ncbi:zinc-binding metallopeptidase family protein [Halopseudomonas pelagia]|uniref:zinc-binding metallopeptidase family protein n=1 Tax=Halopseudomonas pelagia TaxID=553151 RepID=UPI0003A60FFF|nr:putative zinc-binding metallopeptidase [Halopseudomonas pelagia]|tara:strand:+ start:158191 stop:159336 length:1146 start_codon:yes stop_codon:yes gene_type:complete
MSYFDQLVQRSDGSQLFDYHPNGHVQRCRCGQAVFFDNQFCLRCGSALAYHPEQGMLCSIEQEPNSDKWVIRSDGPLAGQSFRLCQHRQSAAQCNWLVSNEETAPFCVACSLNLTIPDLSIDRNADYWLTTEQAKRRLIAQLIMLGLPTVSKKLDPKQGLGFELLRQLPGGPAILTGHMDGVITLNIEEADPAHRETVRQNMHEPYRTMLGHFRHESGHYYWDRLVMDTPWLPVFRDLFGDERLDYKQALQQHYYQGPPADWHQRFISSYAASHPWEDWAETWAHYLHMTDTLNVALDFGIRLDTLKLHIDEFHRSQLEGCARGNDDQEAFLAFINRWVQLSSVLNVLARSMGQPDIYPFVLTTPSLRKLYLVHSVVADVG